MKIPEKEYIKNEQSAKALTSINYYDCHVFIKTLNGEFGRCQEKVRYKLYILYTKQFQSLFLLI